MINVLSLISFALTLTIMFSSNAYAEFINKGPFKILSAVDGDTVIVSKGSLVRNYHLLGIDAPEMDQPYGKEAYDFLSKLINEGNYVFEPVKVYGSDIRFGTIRYIDSSTGNSKSASCELLCQGLAFEVYNFDDKVMITNNHKPKDDMLTHIQRDAKGDKYLGAQKYAVERGLGVWSESRITYPWSYRNKMGMIEIEHEDYLKSIIALSANGATSSSNYQSYDHCYASEKNYYLAQAEQDPQKLDLNMRLANFHAQKACSQLK